jgi:tRNA dimethylallyltransferase
VDKNIIIVGPTASGKSSVAMELAQKVGGEVASVDAFQVYRGLDIGTGKVMPAEQQGIPHHLLDLVDPTEEFSVADYVKAAAGVAAHTGKPIIWAGGTGLYVSALLQGLTPAPPTPKDIQDQLSQRSPESLKEEIQRVDPVWSERADLNNGRRIIRALGVYMATGKPMSEWQQERSSGVLAGAKVFYLCPDPEVLRERINQRVTAMLEGGWIDEVRQLAAVHGWKNSQSSRAIGYFEVLLHAGGNMKLAECEAEIQKRTWQYARRQRTWFRKQDGVITVTADGDTMLNKIFQQAGGV